MSEDDSMTAFLNERDRRYEERFRALETAMEKAVAAVEKQTASAFAANKEAVIKTEEAQRTYNLSHNDLSRKMETQAKQFVDRDVFADKIDELRKALDSLRQHDSTSVGRREERGERRLTAQWTTGQVITVAVALAFLAVAIVDMLKR